jgi:hypothetical protein
MSLPVRRCATLLLAVCLIAGCTSDDDPQPSVAPTATGASAEPTSDPASEPTGSQEREEEAQTPQESAEPSETTHAQSPTSAVPSPLPSVAVKSPSTAEAPKPTYIQRIREHRTATEVTLAIMNAERSLRASAPSAAFTAAARQQQLAFRALAVQPRWLDDVIAGVPPPLRTSVRANAEAAQELRALTAPRPDLPPWRIQQPRPADELLGYYREAQQATGIDWTYLAAINLVETRMGRIRGVSTAGAQGPMQFLPSTWNAPGIGKGDINDPHDAIQAAARFLVRNGAPGDMARALRRYNNSRRYVAGVTAYAREMQRDPQRFRVYHQWGVTYRWTKGEVQLLEGYTPPKK